MNKKSGKKVNYMNYINGNDLYQMFNYGTVNIVNKREKLNELNVFPVPDSDTGNNLASTMQAITQKSVNDESFHESLVSISESALFGAN
jgi:dihydroxyacetone kinase-like predicted kinase